MSRKSLRCVVEINIRAATCPGVWLPRREPVFLSITLLGQVRHTQVVNPIFPLLFHEKFTIDKVFYYAHEPSQIADSLEDELVRIDLLQESPLYYGGCLLASYTGNVRDFLYPNPSPRPSYRPVDRELLMQRSLDFPGISPRLEFSTRTTIKETNALVDLDSEDESFQFPKKKLSSTSQTRRPRSRTRNASRQRGYRVPTISSLSRSRSLSPAICRSLDKLDLATTDLGERPPFVVRKVDSRCLIGRNPGECRKRNKSKAKRKRRGRSISMPRRTYSPAPGGIYYPRTDCCFESRGGTASDCIVCRVYRRYTGRPYWGHAYCHDPPTKRPDVQVIKEPRSTSVRATSPLFSDGGSIDSEVERLTRRYATSPPVRATSPLLSRRTLRSRYNNLCSVSPSSQMITQRVRNAIDGNLRLTPPLKSSRLHRDWDSDSLDQLEADFQHARYRNYYP